MLKYRLLTSLIGVPAVIYIIYLGGIPYFLAVSFVVLTASYELFKIAQNKGINYTIGFSIVLNEAILLLTFINKRELILPLIILFIIISSIYKALIKDNIERLLEEVSAELFSSFYISIFLSYLLLLRNFKNGAGLVILLFGIVWLNDSFAYFIGKKLGKIKINTHISPNKTREGAIGGFIGGTLAGLIFGYFFHFNLLYVFFISLITITISQLGDFIESALKREVGIKDAGNIIPGHGGILDRFDGLIYATPVFYYTIVLIFKQLGG